MQNVRQGREEEEEAARVQVEGEEGKWYEGGRYLLASDSHSCSSITKPLR